MNGTKFIKYEKNIFSEMLVKLKLYAKNKELLELLRKIYSINSDIQCYFVGGFVRDIIKTGESNYDLDIEIFNCNADALNKILDTKAVGKNNQIYILNINDYTIHISLSEFETVEQSALQRDFTINAIYLECKTFEIFCFENAINHLYSNKLEPVTPNIFIDDPIRILRAIRFIEKLNLEYSIEFLSLIRLTAKDIMSCSPERIENELYKTIQESGNLDYTFELMNKFWVLPYIFPIELIKFNFSIIRLEQNARRFKYINEFVTSKENKIILSLATLFYQTTSLNKIYEWFIHINPNYNSHIADNVSNLLKYSDNNFCQKFDETYSIDFDIYLYRQAALNLSNKEKELFKEFIKIIYISDIDDMFFTDYQDIMSIFSKAIVAGTLINGGDIINKYNLKEGPIIGKIINTINELYFLNIINTRNQALLVLDVLFDNILKGS